MAPVYNILELLEKLRGSILDLHEKGRVCEIRGRLEEGGTTYTIQLKNVNP